MFTKKILFLTLLFYSIQNALADDIADPNYNFQEINYGVCGYGCNGVEELNECYYFSDAALGYLMNNCMAITYCASRSDGHGPGGTSIVPICPFSPPEVVAPSVTEEPPAPGAPLLPSMDEPTPPSGRGPLPIDDRYMNGI